MISTAISIQHNLNSPPRCTKSATIAYIQIQHTLNAILAIFSSTAIWHPEYVQRIEILDHTYIESNNTEGHQNYWGHAVAQLRHCTTSRKVAGSIPDGVFRIFHWHNPSGRIMPLESTQPLAEKKITYLLTYLLTHLLHGAESFLRS